jgi:predicted anti-sigma-YlaC factor YlaD
MTSPHEWSLASAAVDGALDEEEQFLFDEHLVHCADCRQELERMREAKTFLNSAPRRSIPPSLRTALENRYAPTRPGWRHGAFLGGHPPRWVSASMAAAAVLGVAIGWWNLMGPGRAEQPALALEPLLAAHARSTSENWIPAGDYFNSNSSAQLTAYENDSSR